jgi:hypothetical protein
MGSMELLSDWMVEAEQVLLFWREFQLKNGQATSLACGTMEAGPVLWKI